MLVHGAAQPLCLELGKPVGSAPLHARAGELRRGVDGERSLRCCSDAGASGKCPGADARANAAAPAFMTMKEQRGTRAVVEAAARAFARARRAQRSGHFAPTDGGTAHEKQQGSPQNFLRSMSHVFDSKDAWATSPEGLVDAVERATAN